MLRRASALLGVSAFLFMTLSPRAVAKPKPSAPPPAPTPAPVPTVDLGIVGPKAEPTSGDLAKARATFDAGGRAYDAGNYAAALQAFEQAYAMTGRDNIVFSIAQA